MSKSKKKSLIADHESRRGKTAPLPVDVGVPICDPRVQVVIDFLSGNFHRRIHLNEIAEAAKLSPSRLSHVFKDEMGISPGKYLRRIRMQKAGSLLATSRLSVKQIMAMAGYDNKAHFVRQFRKAFVVTPSEYRKLRQPDSNKRARLSEE
jgi:AraC family transcriptional regulator of arabinose operon